MRTHHTTQCERWCRERRDILFYIFLGVAVIGVLLFLTLGKEVTEKERKGTDASDRLLVERQGGTLLFLYLSPLCSPRG